MDKRKLKALAQLFVALGLFALVLHHYDLEERHLFSLARSPAFWLITIGGNLLVQWLTTWRWQILLARFSRQRIRLAPLFLYGMYAQFVGLAFLGTFAADLSRGYLIQARHQVPLTEATRSIFLDRMAGTLSITLLGLAALPFYYGSSPALSWGVAGMALLFSCARVELFLSLVAHLLKVAMVAGILCLGNTSLRGVTAWLPHLSLGLWIEHIPISWQGFGLGHLAFATFLRDPGADLYQAYFLGKTSFKLLGGLCLLGSGAGGLWALRKSAATSGRMPSETR